VEGSDKGDDLALGDEPFRLRRPGLRRPLMIGGNQLDLGAAQPGQSLALGKGHLQVGIFLVDDIDGQTDAVQRVLAGLGNLARQWIEGADLHRVGRNGLPSGQRQGGTYDD